LDDPDDVVRFEVERGLERDIPVVPVLVRGAAAPEAVRLPPSLAQLKACYNAQPNGQNPNQTRRPKKKKPRQARPLADLQICPLVTVL
jgi:hypothetical protein